MTEDVIIDDDDAPEIVVNVDEPEIVVIDVDDDDDEPAPIIDTSHEEEPEPEPEPDALADLKRQLDAMSARNQQLEEAVSVSAVAEIDSQLRELDTAIAVSKRNLQAAKDDFAAKLASGDHKGAADAQLRMAETVTDIRDFEGAATEVKAQLQSAKKPAQRTASDPFEASISGVSEKSKEWCRANKADLQKSPARGHRAMSAHMEAMDAGLKADTPEYFEFLNQQMGYTAPVTKTPTPKATAKPVGKARVAAPSGGARIASGSVAEIRLSQDEVRFAKQLGMKPADYAKQKKELIENGRDPSRSGPRYSNQTEANRR